MTEVGQCEDGGARWDQGRQRIGDGHYESMQTGAGVATSEETKSSVVVAMAEPLHHANLRNTSLLTCILPSIFGRSTDK